MNTGGMDAAVVVTVKAWVAVITPSLALTVIGWEPTAVAPVTVIRPEELMLIPLTTVEPLVVKMV